MSVSRFLKEIGRPVAYYPNIARMVGSVNAAVLLCQLLYWSDKGEDPNGWIYKTQVEVEEETGLTRRKQETAREKLVELGILEEARRGTHGTLHFRINTQTLDEVWAVWRKAPMAESANEQIRQRPEATNANGGKRHSLNKDTETTTENTNSATQRNRRAPKPHKRDERQADPRTKYPAIQLVKQLTGYYPRLILYDKIIDTLGDHPDFHRARDCAVAWAGRGFRMDNFDWVFSWYVKGIPEAKNDNGTKRPNGGRKSYNDRANAALTELYDLEPNQ